jgi:transcriptional regulator with XRE-family HTH domain
MPRVFNYKTYNFVDKDPVVDLLRTIIKETGMSYKEIADKSGVSQGTLMRWFYGDVRRPQHATIMAVTRAMGYDMKMTRVVGPRLVVDNGVASKAAQRRKK